MSYYPQQNSSYTAPVVSNDGGTYDSYWFWIILALVIVAIGLAIAALVWVGTKNSVVLDPFISIKEGVVDGTSDTFDTSKFDMYIGKSDKNVNLNITASDVNIAGRQLYIKNDTTTNIVLDTRSLTKYSDGKVSNGGTVAAGVNAEFIFVGTNDLLRLQ